MQATRDCVTERGAGRRVLEAVPTAATIGTPHVRPRLAPAMGLFFREPTFSTERRSTRRVSMRLNHLDSIELSNMPNENPVTGPMIMQPEHISNVPTQVLPMRPTDGKLKRAPQTQQLPTRADGVRAAKAKITRRNSLRKQREALKG
jgi:hypothetical protein